MILNIHTVRLLLCFLAIFLTTPLFAETLDESQIQALVKKEVQRLLNTDGVLDSAIQKGITDYIKNQKLAAEQTKNHRQQVQAKDIRPVDTQRDHIRGKLDAPVTLVEYSDYECPYCKRFHPTVVKLLEDNPDKVRWVYRHFPLAFHNPGAQKQAEATECAAELGGNDAFWQYSDLLYERTKSNGKGFPLENLGPLAEEIGLDVDAFSQCLESGRYTARVNEDIGNARKIGVTGTPIAFILNQTGDARVVSGALPLARLQSLVDELIK